MKSTLLAASCLLLVLTAGCKQATNTPTPGKIDPAQAQAIAKDAYIFTYPLVMNYRTMYKQAIEGDHAFGKWLNLGISSPSDTDIVTPNNDTPYSYAWLDLRAEPWVLTLPKIEPKRFYTSQWDDMWGYVLDNPGSILDGNNGTTVLLASPNWKGDLPKGVNRVIRGESDFLGSLTRTQLIGGKADLPRVKEIQAGYKLQPLSQYLKTNAPSPAPTIDWPKWTEGDETNSKYWSYVSFLLPYTTPNPADSAIYDKMASIGIKPDFKLEDLDPAIRSAVDKGSEDARAEMKKQSEIIADAGKLFGNRERLGADYLNRAMGVYMGIFGNVTDISVYYSVLQDSNGQPLDGSKSSYTITFPKGQAPSVKYFWSMTMYNLPQRLLVANPIDRYSIGSATPGLKYNDGSVTIYFSPKSPGKERESNWLPAPSGPFWVVLRCYGPSKEIIDGTWQKPKPVPVS
jgi:hypothetical protein